MHGDFSLASRVSTAILHLAATISITRSKPRQGAADGKGSKTTGEEQPLPSATVPMFKLTQISDHPSKDASPVCGAVETEKGIEQKQTGGGKVEDRHTSIQFQVV